MNHVSKISAIAAMVRFNVRYIVASDKNGTSEKTPTCSGRDAMTMALRLAKEGRDNVRIELYRAP